MSSSPIIPDLPAATLQQIIPVAEQRSSDDVVVTVTSLERYASGFVVNVRIDWDGKPGPFPQLNWRAVDDRGVQHFCPGCGGSGGGPRPPLELMAKVRLIPFIGFWLMRRIGNRRRAQSWRMHCPFSYAIPDGATELTLGIASFRLDELVMKDVHSGDVDRIDRVRETTPVGTIVVPLVPNP